MSGSLPPVIAPLRRSHSWLWALVLAVVAHASFALFFLPDRAIVEIERSAGAQAVVMGSLDAAFAAQSELPTPEAEEIEAVSDVPDLARPVAPQLLTQPELDIVDSVQPLEVAPNAVRLAELVKPVKPEKLDAPKPQEMRKVPPEEVLREIKPAEIEPIQEVAALQPTPPEKPLEVKERPKEKPKKAKAARGETRKSKSNADSRRGANQKTAKTARSAVSGRGGKRITAGGAAAMSDYRGKVAAKLRRAQRYPSAARSRRMEGIVILSFTLDASGALVSSRVVRSSGHALLDQAALDLVRKVRGFPKIPPELGRKTMPINVPLEYVPGRR